MGFFDFLKKLVVSQEDVYEVGEPAEEKVVVPDEDENCGVMPEEFEQENLPEPTIEQVIRPFIDVLYDENIEPFHYTYETDMLDTNGAVEHNITDTDAINFGYRDGKFIVRSTESFGVTERMAVDGGEDFLIENQGIVYKVFLPYNGNIQVTKE